MQELRVQGCVSYSWGACSGPGVEGQSAWGGEKSPERSMCSFVSVRKYGTGAL